MQICSFWLVVIFHKRISGIWPLRLERKALENGTRTVDSISVKRKHPRRLTYLCPGSATPENCNASVFGVDIVDESLALSKDTRIFILQIREFHLDRLHEFLRMHIMHVKTHTEMLNCQKRARRFIAQHNSWNLARNLECPRDIRSGSLRNSGTQCRPPLADRSASPDRWQYDFLEKRTPI